MNRMENDLRRELGLADAVAVVVGTLIGSGIFLVPNLVARQLPSPARSAIAPPIRAALWRNARPSISGPIS